MAADFISDHHWTAPHWTHTPLMFRRAPRRAVTLPRQRRVGGLMSSTSPDNRFGEARMYANSTDAGTPRALGSSKVQRYDAPAVTMPSRHIPLEQLGMRPALTGLPAHHQRVVIDRTSTRNLQRDTRILVLDCVRLVPAAASRCKHCDPFERRAYLPRTRPRLPGARPVRPAAATGAPVAARECQADPAGRGSDCCRRSAAASAVGSRRRLRHDRYRRARSRCGRHRRGGRARADALTGVAARSMTSPADGTSVELERDRSPAGPERQPDGSIWTSRRSSHRPARSRGS